MIRTMARVMVLGTLWVSVCGARAAAPESAAPSADEARAAAAKLALGQPFWKSAKMDNEPILFVQEKGQPVATGKLMFTPRAAPHLTAADPTTVYVAGQDYVWRPGSNVIALTPQSRIPFKTAAEMVPPHGGPHTLSGVLWSEGRFFNDLQVLASYEHNDSMAWPAAAPQVKLTRSLGKLKAGQAFKIVALGDSITEGYNASGFAKVMAPPYQPPYPQLVANTLEQRFGAKVTLANLAVGGTRADWGLSQIAKVTAEKPDLVILAFGMNNSEPAPAFAAIMHNMVAAVQAGSPNADVVLVACMTGNPRVFPVVRFVGYRDALRTLATTNVALADMTAPWLELLKRKSFSDLSGNNINHPNDFSHRVYAQVICELFPSPR